jgi:hypothetical protein
MNLSGAVNSSHQRVLDVRRPARAGYQVHIATKIAIQEIFAPHGEQFIQTWQNLASIDDCDVNRRE